MNWFLILFPLTAMLFPALLMTLVQPQRSAKIDLAKARRLTAWLWLATLSAVGLWAAVYFAFSPRAAFYLWPLFFALWFGFWGRLMRVKNPDWVSMPPADLPSRSASLTPRLTQPAVPAWSTRMIWLAWAACFAAVLIIVDWSVLRSADAALASRRSMGWLALAISVGIVFIAPLVMFCLRLDRREPQTLDPDGSPELLELYSRRRTQRAWLFVGLGLTMILLQGSIAITMALISSGALPEQQTSTMLAWAAGIAGSIVGIAGAIVGTMSSIQAARINRRLRELTQASA